MTSRFPLKAEASSSARSSFGATYLNCHSESKITLRIRGWTMVLQFDISGVCNGEPKHWLLSAETSLEWSEDHYVANAYKEIVGSLRDKVDGCHTEVIKASVERADNADKHFRSENEAKKDAEAAENAIRLEAEWLRKEAEANARLAKKRAEEQIRTAEESRKLRAGCALSYQNTADK